MEQMLRAVKVCAVILVAPAVFAQDESTIKVTQLTDRIYQLSTDQGSYTTNVLMFVGDDGILLVDTGEPDSAEELKKLVLSFGKGAPKYIINTHRHVEHLGANALFGDSAVIIAHDLVRTKLRSGAYLFDEFPEASFPDITLTDSLNLYFNGEKIRVVAMPGSHDDNEVIVHFTASKVVHISSLINGLNFPSVDADGDVLKFPELVARATEILPQDVTIVSGHNQNCRWQDLQGYHDMLVKTTEIVRQGLEEGKDVQALQKEDALKGFEAYAGSYVSKDQWIEYLADGIQGKERKKRIYEPMYYALRDGGADAAVAKYRELKRDSTDQYELSLVHLLVIGDKLVDKKRLPEAIRMLDLGLEEYPDDRYAYYVNYDLSRAYRDLGKKDEAVQHCRESIKLKPDFKAGAALLTELEKM